MNRLSFNRFGAQLLLLLTLLTLTPLDVFAKSWEFKGVVTDAESGQRIAGAAIVLRRGFGATAVTSMVTTNAKGEFVAKSDGPEDSVYDLVTNAEGYLRETHVFVVRYISSRALKNISVSLYRGTVLDPSVSEADADKVRESVSAVAARVPDKWGQEYSLSWVTEKQNYVFSLGGGSSLPGELPQRYDQVIPFLANIRPGDRFLLTTVAPVVEQGCRKMSVRNWYRMISAVAPVTVSTPGGTVSFTRDQESPWIRISEDKRVRLTRGLIMGSDYRFCHDNQLYGLALSESPQDGEWIVIDEKGTVGRLLGNPK